MKNEPFIRLLFVMSMLSLFPGFHLHAQSCNAPDINDLYEGNSNNAYLGITLFVPYNPLSLKDSAQVRLKKANESVWTPLEKQRVDPNLSVFSPGDYAGWDVRVDIGREEYQVQARVYCRNGAWSPWSATKTMRSDCNTYFYGANVIVTPSPDQLRFGLGDYCCSNLYEGHLSLDEGNTFRRVETNTQPFIQFDGLQENRSYPFKFKLQCSGGSFTQFSDVVEAYSTCRTPVFQSNFFIRPLSQSTIEVSCTKNADRFQFRLRERGQSAWTTSPEKTQDRHTFVSLELGKRYELQCRVRCGGPDEVWTEWSDITTYEIPFACPIPAVSDLAAQNVDHFAATLVCTSSQHQDGLVQEHVFRYKRRDDNAWTEVRTSNNQTRIRGLMADTRYQVQAKHNCILNNDGALWSDTLGFRTEFYDCGVRDSAIVFRNIQFEYADFVCKAADKYGYWWRYREVGRSQWTESGLVESNRWTALGLKEGTEYEVQLRIWCNGNYSAYTGSRFFSTLFCTDPDDNYMRANDVTNHTAVLAYQEGIRQGVEWQYRKQGNTNWQRVQSNRQDTPIEGLMPGTWYDYRVRLLCDSDPEIWSEWSIIEQFGTPCDAVIQRFSRVTPTSVRVHCSAAGALGYYVRYRPGGTTVWRDTGVIAAQEFDIFNLTPNTEYEFQVLGTCGSESGLWSESSFVSTDAPRTTECRAPRPSELSADPVSFSTAQLNCSVGGRDSYQFRYAGSGLTQWNELAETPQDFARLFGLASNTVFHFQARVRCGETLSPWSDSIRFETQDPNVQTLFMNAQCYAPAVSTLFASQIETASAVLNCLDLRGGSKYQFRIKLSNGNQWVELTEQNVAYMAVNGLQENTSYDFQCRIFCNGAYGPYSGSRTFRTQSGQTCDEPVGAEFLAFEVGEQEASLVCLKEARLYEFRYKPRDAAFWTTLPAGQDSVALLEDLAPDEEYVFQVRILCSNNQVSPFSNGRVFRTQPACTNVAANTLSAASVQASSAILNCSASGYLGFMFRYRRQGTEEWRYTRPEEAPSVMLDSLTPQTVYEYQALGFCSETSASTWSAAGIFTTASVTSTTDRLMPLSWAIYPNPVQNDLHVQIDPTLVGCFYEIVDLMGRQVSSGMLNGNLVLLQNISLQPGIYAMRIRKDGRTDTRKFVVQ